ncbi:MAG: hypothetical protein M8357_11885 [Desulfobulbaceae bacterium]|nr:hypothetical protein [Desulfobulbaceae bacterium]
MKREQFAQGINLLRQPVMPLASMVQFLFMTGPFATIGEVIDELPEPIETDRTCYETPRALLSAYLDILAGFEKVKEGAFPAPAVVDEEDNPVDGFTAGVAVIQQQLLSVELERINSALCGPCRCTLCCTGPEQSMAQEFFEIPLDSGELDLFAVNRCDNDASRNSLPLDEEELLWEGRPFYRVAEPSLFHWQKGWSLILPRGSTCPNLNDLGQCLVYNDRPEVCRRPQIFPYMVESLESAEGDVPALRIRQSLLAVVDCPYVRELQDEIAEYAAASELHLLLKQNKN